MSTFLDRITQQWRDGLNFVLGLWIVLSPWVLGFTGEAAAAWNAWIVGAVVAVAAAGALIQFHRWEEWLNAALGLWLIASPWVLGVAAIEALVWNQVIAGLIVGGLAVWTALAGAEPEGLASQS